MDCDLCGKSGEMFRAVIEGSQVTVCKSCSKYGTVTGRVKASIIAKKKHEQHVQKKPENIELVIANFGEILKKKREELGMSQRDFAMKIAEKESALHKMETGTLVPTLDKARKLEKMLDLKLVEEVKEEAVEEKKDDSVMTLGDFVKIKKRKSKQF